MTFRHRNTPRNRPTANDDDCNGTYHLSKQRASNADVRCPDPARRIHPQTTQFILDWLRLVKTSDNLGFPGNPAGAFGGGWI